MTPRRSSRARTSQPSPAILQHTNSSSSSTSLNRGERNTRSNHKISSPQRSSTQRSQSIDDADGGSKNDFPHTRQRRARGEDDQDPTMKQGEGEDEEEDGEDEEEEEEITRCLCGQQEYPGLPPSRREAVGRSGLPAGGVKDEAALNLDSSDLLSDDVGSMFIQCDSCKVWQHGGCVGIMDEAMSPDEYFCEECRKDLHRIRSEPNGQYSSSYLPVAPVSSPAPSSRASSQDTSRRGKDSKSRQNDPNNVKRRSTMNSRDAAYDEEEQLRRAIEESKEDTKSDGEETVTRRGKRSRSDSEAHRQTSKRQRTSSPTPTAASKQSHSNSQPASEDESKAKLATNGAKKQRATSRGHREKETKDTEEPEAERPETGNRRKGRTEKRKDDESEHEVGSPPKSAVNEPEPSQPSPDTPAVAQEPAPSRPSTRKSGRPPARRGARVGRNQYTRDRDTNGNGAESNMLNSPRRGHSNDTGGDSPRVGGANGTHLNGTELGKPSRPRYINPQRTTMPDMKRRVAAILEFISRMQVEMAVAGESSPASNGDRMHGTLLKNMVDSLETFIPSGSSDGGESGPATDGESGAVQPPKEKDFKDLSSVEMMDVLTRHLLKWQQEFGKFPER
ncbi:hypothetical protein AWENTII_003557 [Aspergillus wentii]|nr:hypothetical protein MW887_011799 [Aspergillus wentii]